LSDLFDEVMVHLKDDMVANDASFEVMKERLSHHRTGLLNDRDSITSPPIRNIPTSLK